MFFSCRKTENVLNVHIDVVPYFDLKNMEMDIDKAFTMTSEIIALEIVNRIMITLFEVQLYFNFECLEGRGKRNESVCLRI